MYKYFTFNEHAITNILNNEFYMSHHELFNDPFECWCEILTGFPSKNEKSARLDNILNVWGFDDIEDTIADEYYESYIASLVGSEPDIPTLINSARITCFSKRPDNLLMWSHYADGLRGFCLQFDPDIILHNNNIAKIYEVEYKEKPAIIDTALIAALADQIAYNSYALESIKNLNMQTSYNQQLNQSVKYAEEIFRSMLATKPIDWIYEEELRIIYQSLSEGKQPEFMNYPRQAIKSVIFGEKMAEKHKNALQSLFFLDPYKIEFKTAKRDKGSFGISIYN